MVLKSSCTPTSNEKPVYIIAATPNKSTNMYTLSSAYKSIVNTFKVIRFKYMTISELLRTTVLFKSCLSQGICYLDLWPNNLYKFCLNKLNL